MGEDDNGNPIDRWAITDGHSVLDKDGDWIIEPLPSSRDDEYIAKTRWASAEEAYAFWISRYESNARGEGKCA